MLKIIFLDIDGVCNTPRTWGNRPLEHALETHLVGNVQRLISATDAELVLSSTWRKSVPLPTMFGMLKEHGLEKEFLSATPVLHCHRILEILSWLDEFTTHNTMERAVSNFTILDDNTGEDAGFLWNLFSGHWVKIDPWQGFSPRTDYYEQALAHLLPPV